MTRLLMAAGLIVAGLVPTLAIREGAIDFNNEKPDQSAVVVETPVLKCDDFEKTYWCPGCLEVDVWNGRAVCDSCGSTETKWFPWRRITIEKPMFGDAVYMYQQASNGDLHANHKLFERIPEEFKIEGSDKLYNRSSVILTGRPKFQ